MTLQPRRPRHHQPELDRPVAVRGDPFLDGTVDDFHIYDRALSAADIAALAGGQPGAGNVADYKFDEDSGETALDSSGNGRNATIISPGERRARRCGSRCPTVRSRSRPARPTCPSRAPSGFTVGQKMAIGYGRTFETATVTAVGTPGTQDWLAAAAPAGATNIKVTSTANITAGDTIRLDIGAADRDRHRRVGGHRRRERHRPHPDRPAEVRPLGQPAVQRPRHRHHLHPGDPLRALEQRARAGAGQQHHPRQPARPQPRDQRRRWSTPRSRPRATRGHRHPTSGSAARPCPPAPAAWCCATPGAWWPTASTTEARRPVGRRGLPGRVRDRAGRLLRALAGRGQRRRERRPLPRRQRHRQQLRRLLDHQQPHARCRQPGLHAGPGPAGVAAGHRTRQHARATSSTTTPTTSWSSRR